MKKFKSFVDLFKELFFDFLNLIASYYLTVSVEGSFILGSFVTLVLVIKMLYFLGLTLSKFSD